MASANFLFQDDLEKIWFFEEIFLLADTSMEIVSKMLFLSFSNIKFQFDVRKLT